MDVKFTRTTIYGINVQVSPLCLLTKFNLAPFYFFLLN